MGSHGPPGSVTDSPCGTESITEFLRLSMFQGNLPDTAVFPGLNFHQNGASVGFFSFWDAGRAWGLWKGIKHPTLNIFSFGNGALFLMWLQKYLSQLAEESLKVKEEGSHLPQDDSGIVPHFAKKKLWCRWTGRAIMSECWYFFFYYFYDITVNLHCTEEGK